MLTYRSGAAAGQHGGAMADYLIAQVIPVSTQAMAAYYQRGMENDPALADAARIAPEPRRDMNPALANLLGIDTTRPVTRDEIAHLLAGQRADGAPIEGKRYKRGVIALADVFGVDPLRVPTPDDLAHLLAGRKADGTAIAASADTTEMQEAEPSQETQPIIAVSEALDAAGVAYRRSGGRLRIQASWRGGDGYSVSINESTGQWVDHAANERGNFAGLKAKLHLGEARTLAEGEAQAVQQKAEKAETFRRTMATRLWREAMPGTGEIPTPHFKGSAGAKIRRRAEHAAHVAAVTEAREIGRRYLEARHLDADWLLPQIRFAPLHPKYDAAEIAQGAKIAMLTPMFGQRDGAVVQTGVQRTYLSENGQKIGRRMLGDAGAWLIQPPEGAATRIGGHNRVLLAGEGFETVASVVQHTRQPGVVAYNAGGVVAWAEKYHGETPVVLLADRDNPKLHQGRQVGYAGQRAAAEAVDLLKAKDVRALYLQPPAEVTGGAKGGDWADALAEHGPDGLRQAVRAATASSAADLAAVPRKPEAEKPAVAETHPDMIRLHRAFGVKEPGKITEAERAHILAGKMADGGEIDIRAFREAMTHSRTPIGYIDFTWSADKSVSIAWAFAPTEAERNLIAAAHKRAVSAAMRELEREIGQARKGAGGKDGAEPGHIGWITFDHYAARPTLELVKRNPDGTAETELVSMKVAGDPQLHTHVTAMNVVLTDSGRVGSLHTAKMKNRIHEWGAIYQAHLARHLQEVGINAHLDEKLGAARIMDVPEHVRALFSKRSAGAVEYAKELARGAGLDWDTLDGEARKRLVTTGAKAKRAHKDDDLDDLETWRRQASAIGYQHKSVIDHERKPEALTRAQQHERAYAVGARLLERDFDRRAVITEADMRIAAARGFIGIGSPTADDVTAVRRMFAERGITQDQRHTSLVEVAVGSEADDVRITTTLHLAEEREVIALARKHAANHDGALNREVLERAVAASGLDFSGDHGKAQRKIIDHLGMGGHFAAAVGAAGAGKTAIMTPMAAAWREQGRDVHGVALAWRQAGDLRAAGIRNIAAVSVFLDRADQGKIALGPNSVVVVDELGTLGTRQMLGLLRLQERHGFKLVAVGDGKQCQSIEAGFVLGLLERAVGKLPSVETSLRQIDARSAWITAMLRDGFVEQALAMKREDGTAMAVPGGRQELVERVAALWHERMAANEGRAGYTLSVSAPTNEDARAISVAIRAKLALGPDLHTFKAVDPNSGAQYDLPLAQGDKVRLFARTRALYRDGSIGAIGDNGSVPEVRGIARDGIILRNEKGREGLVEWNQLADKKTGRARLTYGYAMTTNTAQGLTSSEHIFATPNGSQTTDGHKAYVSGSRHRERDFWLTSEGAERQEIAARRPLGDPRIIRQFDIWDNWARNIARRPEKLNATDLIREAEQVRLDAARGFMQGAHRRESSPGFAERLRDVREHVQASRVAQTVVEAATMAREAMARLSDARVQKQGRGLGR